MSDHTPDRKDKPASQSRSQRQSLPITPPDDTPLPRILNLLETGSIDEERGRLRWSSNYTFLVSVCDDELKARAIYKPQRGERPLWDFPDGTLCYREKAAFEVSELLGWCIVPATILREGPHGLGSIQLYIQHNPDITYFNLDDSFIPQLQRIAAFDYITNNADRKGGHCLLEKTGKLWGIDHGLCFHIAPKLRTVIWDFAGKPLPDSLKIDVERLGGILENESSEICLKLARLISQRELDALRKRVIRLTVSGIFPDPGHGPSYPWPPV